MVDYVRLISTASRLITANGRSISFRKPSETPSDSNKPWNGPTDGDEIQLDLTGVFVPPNTVREFGISALGEGTELKDLITFSQQIVITAPGENDLREYSSLVDRDDRWGILGMQVLRPGDLQILAFVGVRR